MVGESTLKRVRFRTVFCLSLTTIASCSSSDVNFFGRSNISPGVQALPAIVPQSSASNVDLGQISGAIELQSQAPENVDSGGLVASPYTIAAPFDDSYISLTLGLP